MTHKESTISADAEKVEFCSAQPELLAQDLEEATEFYKKLGFGTLHRNGDIHQVMRGGSVTIHLSSLKKHPGSCQLEVKNVDRLFEIVSTTGVQILYDGVGDRDWGCRDFTFRDSSGNIVTFSEQL